MIQKPPSFIHATGFEPQPIASAIYNGATSTIPDVIIATVTEAWAGRTAAVRTNTASNLTTGEAAGRSFSRLDTFV